MPANSGLLITPQQLYEIAASLGTSQTKIQQSVQNLGSEIERISVISFLGFRADQILQDYHQQKATMETWSNTLEAFALLLTAAAAAFVAADAIDNALTSTITDPPINPHDQLLNTPCGSGQMSIPD